ncbi:hypothetical protein GWI33_002670 [Rhynchophorus ferrugineus]|uniref:BTB domain-containing protein n=1 Tax=Rhynchophorus ferrugineus TaxID=354439 RepID=A0A834IP79_RHYFE|nr:hypothetical protein GWI33_002670 [Rhynchophorus ferrugineus]
MSDKLRVKWLEHVDHFKKSLSDFLEKEKFCDVTITSEGKMFKAHQIILSMCSPYFEKIFKNLPKNNYPTVLFQDISATEIELLLSFVYKGEAIVPRNTMASFFRACETLQIEGIYEDNAYQEQYNLNGNIESNSVSSEVFYSVQNTEENDDNGTDIMQTIDKILQDVEECSDTNNATQLETEKRTVEELNHNVPETQSDKECTNGDVTNGFLQKHLEENIVNSYCNESPISEPSFVFPLTENSNQNYQDSSSQVLILDESPIQIVVLSDDDNCGNNNSASKNIKSPSPVNKNMDTVDKENNLDSDEIEKLSTVVDMTADPPDTDRLDDIEEFLDISQPNIGNILSDDSEIYIPVRSRINKLIYSSNNTVNGLDNPSNNNFNENHLLEKLKLEAIEKAKNLSVLLEAPSVRTANKHSSNIPESNDQPQVKRLCRNTRSDSSSNDDIRLVIEDDDCSNNTEGLNNSNNDSTHKRIEDNKECSNQNEILVRKDPARISNFPEISVDDSNDEYVSKMFNSVTEVPKHLLKQYCVQCKRCVKKEIFREHCHKHSVQFSCGFKKNVKKKSK